MIVWLSSYPRSGNTFTRTLIKRCLGYDTYSIYNDSDIGGDAALTDLTGHKQLSSTFGQSDFDLSEMRASEELYFLKTHEPDRSLVTPEDKVVYLVRDPSKTALSFQQYLRDYHSIEATFGEIIMGKVFPDKGWAEHVRNWCASGHANTLQVKFEDLTSEPLAAIKGIAKFADLNVENENIPSFEELNGVSPKFFARGSSRGKDTSISQPDIALMVLAGSGEMSEHGYAETPGDLLDGIDVKKISSLTNAFWRVVGMERKEVEKLRFELSKATKRAVKSESHIEKTTDILNSMTGQLNEAQTQQAAVLEKLETSNRELSSSRMTVVEQARQVADLTNSNESLTEKLSEQVAENKALIEQVRKLNDEMSSLRIDQNEVLEKQKYLERTIGNKDRKIEVLTSVIRSRAE
ncbi:sulfotransferase domain-containing protein [Parvularcula marina]|uniref:sulfotransferase domain-containing protein n=1 Tax=Parvularcula marina TaxID=2292771 RepID=UPI0035128FBD